MSVRKKDITDWYKQRYKLTINEAECLFCNNHVLESIDEKYRDGLKLCTYLLLEKLGTEKAWTLIRNFVVNQNPTDSICFNLGSVLQKAYNDALGVKVCEQTVARPEIAQSIFKPLMEHCILVKRKYADKFCHILRGTTIERDTPMSKMLFNISTPIVWRYLNATNSHIRRGAFCVQSNVFPPISDDPIQTLDYTNKHCEAFLKALSDPVVDICLQAIDSVCEIVALWFSEINEMYVDKIFKELASLAEDENQAIRAAVYHGLRHFHECAKGVLKFESLLKQICTNGISDPSEHVRCNVFRLLNSIIDMKISVIGQSTNDSHILSLEDVLHRLDYEESEAVEVEIARCIYLNLFDKQLSNETRYKTLNNICRINKVAGLDFHRLLYQSKVADSETIVSHMISILTVGLRILRIIEVKKLESSSHKNGKQGGKKDTTEIFDLNTSLSRFNNILDCMVVCLSTLRYDPNFTADNTSIQVLNRLFLEIADDIVTQFDENHSQLLNSALSILSLLRKAGVHASKIKNATIKMLKSGELKRHFLEVYGLIDMEELLKLLQQGLDQLEVYIFNANDNPRKRKLSKSTDFANPTIVIKAIMELLNFQSCTQYIVQKFGHYVSSFCETFDRICDKFVAILETEKVDMKVFSDCWQLRTILTIIKFNKEAFMDFDDDEKGLENKHLIKSRTPISHRKSIISQIHSNNTLDPLIEESSWITCHIDTKPQLTGNSDFVESFYRITELHFRAYKHRKNVVNTTLNLVKKVHRLERQHGKVHINQKNYISCLQAGKHALDFAESVPKVVNDLAIFEEELDD